MSQLSQGCRANIRQPKDKPSNSTFSIESVTGEFIVRASFAQIGAIVRKPHTLKGLHHAMTARIFRPAKTAMQSGTAKTRQWQLDYEPEQPRTIEPLMGWTSSGDMKQQLTIRFDTKDDAVAYCEREGIPYEVIEPKEQVRRQVAYADNFAFRRTDRWTH